jgi:hypothetical protein
MTPYSPRRRTALLLAGTGTAGAYHAGVLKALGEAGVKIDVVAGCGIGAAGALVAAIDGGECLWGERGLWRGTQLRRWYGWRWAPRLAGAVAGLLAGAVLGAALALAWLDGWPRGRSALGGGRSALASARASPAPGLGTAAAGAPSPAVLVGLVGLLALVGGSVAAIRVARRRRRLARRARGARLWRLIVPPLSATRLQRAVTRRVWQLLRGAVPIAQPSPEELSRRYAELLAENVGQVGFRELLIVAHDLDARSDLVFALLGSPYREMFFEPGAAGREACTVDLAGAGRSHVLDGLWGALALPVATPAHLMRFASESPWRGETHRLGHRPEAVVRLLQELERAGVEQVLLVTATALVTGPHALGATRRDLRGALGELLASREAAAIRDATVWAAGRLALFPICPTYNPVGPLDLAGAYDERSDRWHSVEELIYRGYEDAYRQFIEPVVAPSGERSGDLPEAGASA